MREIKFRFVYKSKIPNDNDINLCCLTLDELIDGVRGVMSAPRNHEKWKLVAKDQYTGLKDKNGKDCYQGDLVQDIDGHMWRVFWNNECACFDLRLLGADIPKLRCITPTYLETCEIIGILTKTQN